MAEDIAPLSEQDSEAVTDVATTSEESTEPTQTVESFWGRVRAMLLGGRQSSHRQTRLVVLDEAIARNMSVPVNYVLRGEIYLEMGVYEAAMADFEYAQKLASYQFEEDNWGLISQVMRDRALAGLAKAKRHLKNADKT